MEFLIVSGLSGAGKSTVMSILEGKAGSRGGSGSSAITICQLAGPA